MVVVVQLLTANQQSPGNNVGRSLRQFEAPVAQMVTQPVDDELYLREVPAAAKTKELPPPAAAPRKTLRFLGRIRIVVRGVRGPIPTGICVRRARNGRWRLRRCWAVLRSQRRRQ